MTPFHSPNGTAEEWIEDPFGNVGFTYAGPGIRLPFYIISPWTRGGKVFVEHADHNSQIMFIEEWQAAKGKNVKSDQVASWRREHMSDLLNAFDFGHPDLSLPVLPNAPAPHVNAMGQFDGSSFCESQFPVQRPPPPFGKQSTTVSALSEKGFKAVRGALTEGRFLTFESNGFALQSPGFGLPEFIAGRATATHALTNQHWVLHQTVSGGLTFKISNAAHGLYLGPLGFMVKDVGLAETFTITYVGAGQYTLQQSDGKYVSIEIHGIVALTEQKTAFSVFSVT